MPNLEGTLLPPPLPDGVPPAAQWLGGQGAGTWFHLSQPDDLAATEFRIQRFAPEGEKECDRVFQIADNQSFSISEPFQFTYVSHCQKCSIVQAGYHFTFIYTGNPYQ